MNNNKSKLENIISAYIESISDDRNAISKRIGFLEDKLDCAINENNLYMAKIISKELEDEKRDRYTSKVLINFCRTVLEENNE